MLRLARKDLERIYEQVLEEYPHECCGILAAGPEADVASVHICENMQQRRHEEDPERYPRDARTAYLIDPGEQLRISEAAEKDGGRISGFYHSHIDCEAYFSEEDERRTWIFNSREAGEEPDDPDALYFVVSAYGEDSGAKREIRAYKCFAWDGAGYAEAGVEIVD